MPQAKSSKATNKVKTAKKAATKTVKKVAAAKVSKQKSWTESITSVFTKKSDLRKEVRLGSMSAELMGAFVLTSVFLVFSGNALVVGIALVVLVTMLGRLSGAHLNPAVTVAMWATKQVSTWKSLSYLVSQLLGAMLALVVVTQFVNSNSSAVFTPQVFELGALTKTWVPFWAEALGALVLGFAVAAVVMNKKDDHESGLNIGLAYMIALFLAGAFAGGAAVLNPAVALGLSGYDLSNWWTVWVYALAPVLGAVAGAWLYKLLQKDVERR